MHIHLLCFSLFKVQRLTLWQYSYKFVEETSHQNAVWQVLDEKPSNDNIISLHFGNILYKFVDERSHQNAVWQVLDEKASNDIIISFGLQGAAICTKATGFMIPMALFTQITHVLS